MPTSLLNEKIKEALVSTGHDRHDAQRLLMTWAIRDPALLLSMTKPHLKAIASSHIEHFLRQAGGGKRGGSKDDKLSSSALEDIVAASTVQDRRKSKALPPTKSSARHESAMRKIAEAFSRKKK